AGRCEALTIRAKGGAKNAGLMCRRYGLGELSGDGIPNSDFRIARSSQVAAVGAERQGENWFSASRKRTEDGARPGIPNRYLPHIRKPIAAGRRQQLPIPAIGQGFS